MHAQHQCDLQQKLSLEMHCHMNSKIVQWLDHLIYEIVMGMHAMLMLSFPFKVHFGLATQRMRDCSVLT